MRPRTRHLFALAVAAASVLVGPVPEARASSEGTINVVGSVNGSAGDALPCFGTTGPVPLDPASCPVLGSGNTVSQNFIGQGVGEIKKANKAFKCPGFVPACVESLIWSITLTNTKGGWCRLSSGTWNGTMTPVLIVGTKANTRSLYLQWTDVGGTMIVTGTTSHGETVGGYLNYTEDPTNGSSCTNRNPKRYILYGQLKFFRA